MKDRTRERAATLDDSADLGDHRQVWDWNVRWDNNSNPPTLEMLQRKWRDFEPGWTENGWLVESCDVDHSAATDFLVVRQEWLRIEIENPLKEPFRWIGASSAILEIPAYADAKGRPLATAAGELIQGVTKKRKIWKLTGRKNVSGIPAFMRDYAGSVSSDTVRVGAIPVPKNQLSLQQIDLGDVNRDRKVGNRVIPYRTLDMEVWWNPYGWVLELLNAGYYELVDVEVPVGTGTPITVGGVGTIVTAPKTVKRTIRQRCQDDGQDVTKHVMLNAKGQRPRNKDGTVKQILDASDISVLRFQLDEELPYARILR